MIYILPSPSLPAANALALADVEPPTPTINVSVIFDEFHERNIHSDLGLALASDVKNNLRDDLSLLVMSATLNSDELRDFLPDAVYFECGGKMFETEIFYASERIADEDIKKILPVSFLKQLKLMKREYGLILLI